MATAARMSECHNSYLIRAVWCRRRPKASLRTREMVRRADGGRGGARRCLRACFFEAEFAYWVVAARAAASKRSAQSTSAVARARARCGSSPSAFFLVANPAHPRHRQEICCPPPRSCEMEDRGVGGHAGNGRAHACFREVRWRACRAFQTVCPHAPKPNSVSCGVRTHAQFPAVDLKSTPLTTRAN